MEVLDLRAEQVHSRQVRLCTLGIEPSPCRLPHPTALNLPSPRHHPAPPSVLAGVCVELGDSDASKWSGPLSTVAQRHEDIYFE